jgi:hypothetical protein
LAKIESIRSQGNVKLIDGSTHPHASFRLYSLLKKYSSEEETRRMLKFMYIIESTETPTEEELKEMEEQ